MILTKCLDNKLRRRLRLEFLLERLRAGHDVQSRDLKTWLGQAAFAEYEAAWQEQLKLRDELASKPEAVRQYEVRFRDARLLENRADGYAAKGNLRQARAFRAKSEAAYERLLEFVQELVQADASLHEWFDRIPDVDAENAPSLIAECMPHVVSSRSLNRTIAHHRSRSLKSKREIKREALEAALGEYQDKQVVTENTDRDLTLLSDFLNMTEEGM